MEELCSAVVFLPYKAKPEPLYKSSIICGGAILWRRVVFGSHLAYKILGINAGLVVSTFDIVSITVLLDERVSLRHLVILVVDDTALPILKKATLGGLLNFAW